jgi:ABC-type polysaccharide/polyol phosphate export permease
MGSERRREASKDVTYYTSKKSGLPPLRAYFKDVWRRREFAIELSSSTLRSQQSSTFFGQLWLVINPLLLATVYYVLVIILSGGKNRGAEYFTHLLAGLFAFYFVAGCMSGGASSVTGVGKLVMNQAFPRLLLPITAVMVAIRRFIPTMIVYLIISLVLGRPFSLNQLLAIPSFILLIIFGTGLAALFATMQVYFRDVASLLPYISRIWLYISPILYYPDQIPAAFAAAMPVNPLYGLMGIWTETVVKGQLPPASLWINAVAWTIFSICIGTYFFLRKEREFAVRL